MVGLDELKVLLERAYETGCFGSLEMKEAVVEKMMAQVRQESKTKKMPEFDQNAPKQVYTADNYFTVNWNMEYQ